MGYEMTVDEWLTSVKQVLGREMTADEKIKARTHFDQNPLLAQNYMKPPKNLAPGTRLTRVSNQDDTDIPDNQTKEGN